MPQLAKSKEAKPKYSGRLFKSYTELSLEPELP